MLPLVGSQEFVVRVVDPQGAWAERKFTVGAIDADGDPLTYMLVSPPAAGVGSDLVYTIVQEG